MQGCVLRRFSGPSRRIKQTPLLFRVARRIFTARNRLRSLSLLWRLPWCASRVLADIHTRIDAPRPRTYVRVFACIYKRVREAGVRGEAISFDFDRRGAATPENRIARL